MSGDINVQTFSGKVNINNNLLVGSSHLFVDTVNNRVGITTASPGASLEVNGNVHVATDVTFGGTLTGDGSGLANVNSDSGSWVNGTGNVYLSTTTDKVGIGTTIPSHALTVAAASGDAEVHIQAQGNDGGDAILYFNGSSTNQRKCAIISSNVAPNAYCKQDLHFCMETTNDLSDVDITDSKMVITNAGNVGIGKTSPKARFHIGTQLNTQADKNTIPASNLGATANFPVTTQAWFGNRFNTNDEDYWGLAIGTIFDGSSYLQNLNKQNTNYYNLLLQPNGGNVGVGTASPTYKLDVSGNLRVTTGILDTSWCSGSWLQTCTQSPTVTVYSNNGGGPMSSQPHGGTGMGGNRGRFTAKKAGNYLISCCAIHSGRGGADATGSNLLVVFDAVGTHWNLNNVINTYDEIIDLRVAPSVEEAYTFACQVYMNVGHYFSFRVHSSGYIDNGTKLLCSAALVR